MRTTRKYAVTVILLLLSLILCISCSAPYPDTVYEPAVALNSIELGDQTSSYVNRTPNSVCVASVIQNGEVKKEGEELKRTGKSVNFTLDISLESAVGCGADIIVFEEGIPCNTVINGVEQNSFHISANYSGVLDIEVKLNGNFGKTYNLITVATVLDGGNYGDLISGNTFTLSYYVECAKGNAWQDKLVSGLSVTSFGDYFATVINEAENLLQTELTEEEKGKLNAMIQQNLNAGASVHIYDPDDYKLLGNSKSITCYLSDGEANKFRFSAFATEGIYVSTVLVNGRPYPAFGGNACSAVYSSTGEELFGADIFLPASADPASYKVQCITVRTSGTPCVSDSALLEYKIGMASVSGTGRLTVESELKMSNGKNTSEAEYSGGDIALKYNYQRTYSGTPEKIVFIITVDHVPCMFSLNGSEFEYYHGYTIESADQYSFDIVIKEPECITGDAEIRILPIDLSDMLKEVSSYRTRHVFSCVLKVREGYKHGEYTYNGEFPECIKKCDLPTDDFVITAEDVSGINTRQSYLRGKNDELQSLKLTTPTLYKGKYCFFLLINEKLHIFENGSPFLCIELESDQSLELTVKSENMELKENNSAVFCFYTGGAAYEQFGYSFNVPVSDVSNDSGVFIEYVFGDSLSDVEISVHLKENAYSRINTNTNTASYRNSPTKFENILGSYNMRYVGDAMGKTTVYADLDKPLNSFSCGITTQNENGSYTFALFCDAYEKLLAKQEDPN